MHTKRKTSQLDLIPILKDFICSKVYRVHFFFTDLYPAEFFVNQYNSWACRKRFKIWLKRIILDFCCLYIFRSFCMRINSRSLILLNLIRLENTDMLIFSLSFPNKSNHWDSLMLARESSCGKREKGSAELLSHYPF